MADDDFASLLRAADANATARGTRRLEAGQSVEGTVLQVTVDTVFVDIGAPGDARIQRAEVVDQEGQPRVRVGERIRATVLDPRPDAPWLTDVIGLATPAAPSPEEPSAAPAPVPAPDEVLDATVVKCLDHGVLVDTAKGRGLVPVRDLDLPHGADHRRSMPVGTKLRVVLSSHAPDTQRLRFSVSAVKNVEEQRHAREYAASSASSGGSFGSLGDILGSKLPKAKRPRPDAGSPSPPTGVVRRRRTGK